MPHRCGHQSCDCDTQGKEYCSTHCTQAAVLDEERTTCECGHIACSGTRPVVNDPAADHST